jgi:hypothetical protein
MYPIIDIDYVNIKCIALKLLNDYYEVSIIVFFGMDKKSSFDYFNIFINFLI